MARKQYVIHLNSGEKAKVVGHNVLKNGEIAVNYNAGSPMLMIQKSDSTEDKPSIATFIDEAAVDNKIKKHTDTLTAATTVTSTTTNGVQISVTTQNGKVSAATVGVTYGTFSSETQNTKDGIAGVAAVQDYVAKQIKASEAAALGITAGTNVTITDKSESDKTKVISAKGVAVSETTNTAATDLALRSDVLTNKTNIASISADTKFTGAITGITTGNSYMSVADDGTNAKKISAQVSMLTATTLTATGKLADAKDVKDYVDKQVTASKITGAAGDTNYIKAELKDNKITVSAIAGSTSADTPSGLATATDAKVTLTSSTKNGVTTYTLSQGGKSYTFNIDKERYIQTGAVKTVTTADSPYNGAKIGDYYIDLEIIGTGDANSHLYIPANSLVDDLTINTNSTNYLEINNRQLAARTGDGGLATYAHVTALSGNVDTKFKSYSSATEVQTALGKKANTTDYKVKSGAAGTNTTAAISDDGTLSFNATGTAVASVTETNKSTALALADELKTLSGKVENIKIPTVPVSSVTGDNYITATTTDGKVTVKATTADISSTTTTGLVLNTDVRTLSGAIKTAIDDHTHTLKLVNLSGLKESTVTLSKSEATIDFNGMTIDCGTY